MTLTKINIGVSLFNVLILLVMAVAGTQVSAWGAFFGWVAATCAWGCLYLEEKKRS